MDTKSHVSTVCYRGCLGIGVPVGEWGCVPEYKSALEKQLGEGALEKLDIDAKNNMPNMNEYSKILYENFKKLFI